MKDRARPFPFGPTVGGETSAGLWESSAERLSQLKSVCPTSNPKPARPATIYVVDDLPSLTDLYHTVLKASGYRVKAFYNRNEALAALQADTTPPDLLITDYLGHTMPVDWFLYHCLAAQPQLQILVVSGISPVTTWFPRMKPARFLQKPFTLEMLRHEVKAALSH